MLSTPCIIVYASPSSASPGIAKSIFGNLQADLLGSDPLLWDMEDTLAPMLFCKVCGGPQGAGIPRPFLLPATQCLNFEEAITAFV